MGTIVLGGGLGGLSAGYYLLKRLPYESFTVVESCTRTGGWIRSLPFNDGVLFEQGPRTIRPRGDAGANTLELIEDLGLEDEIVPIPRSSPAAKNRMVYAEGQLHSLPSSLKGLFEKQPLFSKPLYKYFLNDMSAEKKTVDDEPIYDFVERRFGTEVADYLISPLICGICAGNAKEISVNFLMQDLFKYEQQYGNIFKGLFFNMFTMKGRKKSNSALVYRAKREKWSVYSFKQGIETLTNRLRENLTDRNKQINLGMHCNNIVFKNNRVIVRFDNGRDLVAHRLISSVPAHTLANLVNPQHPKLAELLRNIGSVTVGVVNLHFDEDVIPNPGFGFLVPPKEKLPILGVIYDSCCFPRKRGDSVLTVMMGGHWFQHYFGDNPTEGQLLMTAQEQLENTLGIVEQPRQHNVSILRDCIPQYKVGHKKNLQDILNYINDRELPLKLCGSSYSGVGVNDVILSAKNAVESM